MLGELLGETDGEEREGLEGREDGERLGVLPLPPPLDRWAIASEGKETAKMTTAISAYPHLNMVFPFRPKTLPLSYAPATRRFTLTNPKKTREETASATMTTDSEDL